MKKIALFIFMIMLLNWSSAQVLSPKTGKDGINVYHKSSHSNMIKSNNIKNLNESSKTASIQSRWYNYATTIDALPNTNGVLESTFLFPDTLINARYGSTLLKPWAHTAAVILDPTDVLFQYNGSVNISKSDPYRLDSVGIYCKYVRHLASNVVDTLIVEFLAESSLNMPNYYFVGSAIQTNYGTDTLFFKALHQTNGYLSDANKIIIKLPLTAATASDTTASGFNYLKIGSPTAVLVPAGKVVAMSFRFKPGYTYNQTDTLNNMNYFRFYSYEENGNNTYPNYYSKAFFNQSFLVASRGPVNPTYNWDSLFAPSFAFSQVFPYENHLVDFKLSTSLPDPSFRLTVSEIMYNDLSASDSLEYFELFNGGLSTINLSGYTITKGVNYTFPANTYLYYGQYMVIAKDSALINSVFGISGTFQWDSGGLKNSGEVIMIQNAYGDTLAFVDYDDSSPWPVEGDGDGPSIEFCNPVPFYNNDGALWTASNNFISLFNGDSIFGTPGSGCTIISVENPDGNAKNISMYPNPVSNVLYFGNVYSSYEVSIFDITGSQVKHFEINDSNASVNLESFKAGLYFIQFVDKKTLNKAVKKLIIQ